MNIGQAAFEVNSEQIGWKTSAILFYTYESDGVWKAEGKLYRRCQKEAESLTNEVISRKERKCITENRFAALPMQPATFSSEREWGIEGRMKQSFFVIVLCSSGILC